MFPCDGAAGLTEGGVRVHGVGDVVAVGVAVRVAVLGRVGVVVHEEVVIANPVRTRILAEL